MKRIFTAMTAFAALASTAAVPVQATTFPGLRVIYVAVGVKDTGEASMLSFGTSVPCTNQSGQTANVRWSFINNDGGSMGNLTLAVPHGDTIAVATLNGTVLYTEQIVAAATTFQGKVAISSTQSGVFCSAVVGPADGTEPIGYGLHMVRFNAHPGTVE